MKRLITMLFLVQFLIFNGVIVEGESEMIENGKTVKFDYTLTVKGEVADTSEGKAPLEYVHGQGMIITGLEKELAGLKAGDEKEITVAPEEAYGQIDPNAFIEFPKENIASDQDPQVGMVLELQTKTGQPMPAMIVEVKEETVVLNLNHPLAGQELVFDVKIVDVQ